jgi:hypothetical protein
MFKGRKIGYRWIGAKIVGKHWIKGRIKWENELYKTVIRKLVGTTRKELAGCGIDGWNGRNNSDFKLGERKVRKWSWKF